MFYKFENEEWLIAKEVHFPNRTKLTEKNKLEIDGWKWYDVQPFEDKIIENPNPFQS